MRLNLGILIFSLLLSWGGFCAEVLLDVQLTPVGSFEIKSDSVGGKLSYQDSDKTYSSQRLFVRTADLSSGIDLRDEHIHKFLKKSDFQYIELKNVKAKQGRGTGELHVAGQKKEIEFSYARKGDILVASFDINLDDLNLEAPSFMGVRPEKQIGIKVQYELGKILRFK